MFEVSAKILADSIAPSGDRLTTMEVTGHRFILAEFNTHRAFSRNSASSRAIPYAKMRAKVLEQLAYPVSWPAEQRGMQGGEELGEHKTQASQALWTSAAKAAVDYADQLHGIGLHKSLCNRLLEPFLPHTIIVSATDWKGFWDQRCHSDAQPEIRALADAMRVAYEDSEPISLVPGDWHLPLIQNDEWDQDTDILKKVSVARCARVSYLTHDGKRSILEDVRLHNMLAEHKPAHASPFEHVATPHSGIRKFGGAWLPDDDEPRGNFRGWHQLRHILFEHN